MIIKNLSHIDIEEIIGCFLMAFENYFVKMPTDIDYYKQRWKIAKVDFDLSYGMFDNGKLIGFILNAVDTRMGKRIAYNSGTGVLPEYRGQKITKSIYEHALVELKNNQIDTCTLEVITENAIAINAYKSIGFQITKTYKCFSGLINLADSDSTNLKEINAAGFRWDRLPNQEFYSWDNQAETIRNGNYKYFLVLKNNTPESFFIINPESGYLPQFDVFISKATAWKRLFSGIKSVSKNIKINNVDLRLTDKIYFLNLMGLQNTVDQFEMELEISG